MFTPQVGGARRAVGGRGRLHHRRHQGAAGGARSATPSRSSRSCPSRRAEPLPGFKEIKPQVFAGLYPVEANQYDALRDALEKLQAQRRVAALRARGVARRSASASAAASSACCTWTSCRSGSSASSTMDLITTAPTRGLPGADCATARCIEIENPSKMPDPAQHRGDPRADRHRATCTCRRSTSAR